MISTKTFFITHEFIHSIEMGLQKDFSIPRRDVGYIGTALCCPIKSYANDVNIHVFSCLPDTPEDQIALLLALEDPYRAHTPSYLIKEILTRRNFKPCDGLHFTYLGDYIDRMSTINSMGRTQPQRTNTNSRVR